MCDVVYEYAYQPIEGSRAAGGEYLNLNNLTKEQIKSQLPELLMKFQDDEIDSQDWHIDGMTLVMAYLKVHRKKDAVEVLKVMASNSSEPQEYNRLIEQLQ